MLKSLFGNRNVERILLFLLVNEKCYGTQIQTLLRVPLTPVQKALARLEKEGVVSSRFEGKTRIYRFNPTFPLRFELETLLKKAYTLLPSQEKKPIVSSTNLDSALKRKGKGKGISKTIF